MKRFGSFKPIDEVISESSLWNLHLKVARKEDLMDRPNNTVAVFTQTDGEFHAGDVVIKRNGTWVKLDLQRHKIGAVKKLRGFRLGKNVHLKWEGPLDIFDADGNSIVRLDRIIIVRKYGSAPENEMDGTIAYISYKKDQFNSYGSGYYIDTVPDADDDADWYYRAFAVAENGYTDYTSPAFKVTNMTWEGVCEAIRAGRTNEYFEVGDVVRISNEAKELDLVVASINTTVLRGQESAKSLTFLMKYPDQVIFDVNKGEYFKTKDTVALNKTYYIYDGVGNYKPVRPTPGSVISGTLYEANTVARAENGNNRWSASDIRAWCNSTNPFSYSEVVSDYMLAVETKTGILPATPFDYISSLEPDLADAISETTCVTAKPSIDTNGTEITYDWFFIPSLTELTGNRNGSYIEGVQFRLFSQGIDFPTNTMTRSAYQANVSQDAGINIQALNSYGGVVTDVAKNVGYCYIAFSIG